MTVTVRPSHFLMYSRFPEFLVMVTVVMYIHILYSPLIVECSRREENRSSNSLLVIFLREHLYITSRPTVFRKKWMEIYIINIHSLYVLKNLLWSLHTHDILKPDSYVLYVCFGLLSPPQAMKGCPSPCWLSTTHIWVLQCSLWYQLFTTQSWP